MDRAKEESRVLSLLDRLPVRHKILRIGLINPAQIERLTNQNPNPLPLYMYDIASPDASALSTYINRVYKTEWVPSFISLCYCQTNDFLVEDLQCLSSVWATPQSSTAGGELQSMKSSDIPVSLVVSTESSGIDRYSQELAKGCLCPPFQLADTNRSGRVFNLQGDLRSSDISYTCPTSTLLVGFRG